MSRVELAIKHHMCSGCCMWNGIEDVYCTKTGYEVPEGFLFVMASFAETVYLRFPSMENARMFSVGDGRLEYTYGNMKDILGLSYQIHRCGSFEKALSSVCKEIDGGNPVVLGPIDMYYLPYVKMYHKVHIPIHFVLMVGYDTDKDCVLIYDCDREELIEYPISELKEAWNIEKCEVGVKYSYVEFKLPNELKTPEQILDLSMRRKAAAQLADKPYFTGISAFKKMAKDFPNWKKDLSEKSYRTTLMHLPEFWGRVPKLPDRFYGGDGKFDIPYHANMDRLANCLLTIGKEVGNETYQRAAVLFAESGELFQKITDCIVEYICDGKQTLDRVPEYMLKIGSLYEEAYLLFRE